MRRAPVMATALLLLAAATAPAQQKPAADVPLARFIPGEDLNLFARFDGLERHADAWKATAARGILVDTTTGKMLESLIGQLVNSMSAQAGSGPALSGEQMAQIVKFVGQKGMAVGVNGPAATAGTPRITLVFRDVAGSDAAKPLETVVRAMIPEGETPRVLTRQDGRKLVVAKVEDEATLAFWMEGANMVVVLGPDELAADAALAAIDGKAKSAADSPVLAELEKPVGKMEPVGLAWLDGSALPETPPQFGLSGLKRLDLRIGFEGEAVVNITRVVAPSPRKGLLTLLDQPTIAAKDVPPIPGDVESYTLASLDLGKVFDVAEEQIRQASPQAGPALEDVLEAFRQATGGVRLRDDLLANLGPRWAFYVKTEKVRMSIIPFTALADWLFHLPAAVAVVEVKDPEAFGPTIDKLMSTVNTLLAQSAGPQGTFRFVPLDAPAKGYRLVVPPELMPLPTTIDPGLVMEGKYLALSTRVSAAREAIGKPGPKGVVTPSADLLPDGLVMLNVFDPRPDLPELIANLPFMVQMLGRMGPGGPFGPRRPSGMRGNPFGGITVDPALVPDPDAIRARLFPSTTTAVIGDDGLTITSRDAFPVYSPGTSGPVAVALLLPAVQASRSAARRSQSTNNLKQIGLAMHNYHDAMGAFPAAAITDDDGKPLLSWRVAILPYIEQQQLYNEFHLDEPWDSEHNKALIDKMPATYKVPGAKAKDGETYYQVFTGKGALFEVKETTGIASITDGTSNTIMAVEAAEAVPWTKPDDLEFDPAKKLPKLGGHFPGGFNSLFADGSVRFITDTVNLQVLKALITRAGGEVIGADAF